MNDVEGGRSLPVRLGLVVLIVVMTPVMLFATTVAAIIGLMMKALRYRGRCEVGLEESAWPEGGL